MTEPQRLVACEVSRDSVQACEFHPFLAGLLYSYLNFLT